jgi:hypothetical protein
MNRFPILVFSALSLFFPIQPLAAEAPAGSETPLVDRINRVPDEKTGKALLAEIESAAKAGAISKGQKELWSGIVCHNMAAYNPELWLPKALSLLEPLTTAEPLAMGYYGSALTLRGGEAAKNEDVLAASMDVDAGFKWIDKAVKAAPDDLTIRVLRILNGLSVSAASLFKRHDVIRTDLDWLKKQYDTFGPGMKALYHWAEGELALQLSDGGKAVNHFRKAMSADPKGEYGQLAARTLSELED